MAQLTANLNHAQRTTLADELDKAVIALRNPGATPTPPIDWAAILAALMPVMIQLLPLIIAALSGGGGGISPTPAKP